MNDIGTNPSGKTFRILIGMKLESLVYVRKETHFDVV